MFFLRTYLKFALLLCAGAITFDAHASGPNCIKDALDRLIASESPELSQREPELAASAGRRNMLCGPVCSWNLMRGLEGSFGVRFERAASAVDEFEQIFRNRGRRSFDLIEMRDYLESKIRKSGLPFDVKYEHARPTAPGHRYEITVDQLLHPNRASVLSYTLFSPGADGALEGRLSHWLLVKEVKTDKQIISFLDPWTGKERLMHYEEARWPVGGGSRTIRLEPLEPIPEWDGIEPHLFASDHLFVDVPENWVVRAQPPHADMSSTRVGTQPVVATSTYAAPQVIQIENSVRERFDRLAPGSGFSNPKDIEIIVEGRGGMAAELLRTFKDEKLEVVMYRNEEGRQNVAEKGFRNFHQSGRSQGDAGGRGETLGDALSRRERIEASYLGLDPKSYRAIPKEMRFKYAVLRARAQDLTRDIANLTDYGSDSYGLKLDRIRDRLTLSLGDSIDRLLNSAEARAQNFAFTPSSWDQALIPWNRRSYLIPEVLPFYEAKGEIRIARQVLPQVYYAYFEKTALPGLKRYRRSLAESVLQFDEPRWSNGAEYIEAQILGSLDLRDVEFFEFRTSPPQGAFLKALREYGIEIRDARQWPPKPWP